jgi:acyl-coenzyme A thioesterase PaaI-like protein
MFPERRHSNLLDAVHGAITLALIDISLFACMRHVLDGDAAGSVTLDLSTRVHRRRQPRSAPACSMP